MIGRTSSYDDATLLDEICRSVTSSRERDDDLIRKTLGWKHRNLRFYRKACYQIWKTKAQFLEILPRERQRKAKGTRLVVCEASYAVTFTSNRSNLHNIRSFPVNLNILKMKQTSEGAQSTNMPLYKNYHELYRELQMEELAVMQSRRFHPLKNQPLTIGK